MHTPLYEGVEPKILSFLLHARILTHPLIQTRFLPFTLHVYRNQPCIIEAIWDCHATPLVSNNGYLVPAALHRGAPTIGGQSAKQWYKNDFFSSPLLPGNHTSAPPTFSCMAEDTIPDHFCTPSLPPPSFSVRY